MALKSFLHTTGCKYSHFVAPSSYTILESSVLENAVHKKLEKLPVDNLASWLSQPVPENGLKLLVHQWSPWRHGDSHNLYDPSSNLVFPAKDKSHYTWIASQMKLPESFILNFSRRQATPLEITKGEDGRIEMICQTPDYSNSFSSLALSHDPHTNSTTGVLCFTSGSMSKVLDLIFEIPSHAGTPLLLPSLIFWIFASIQRRQLRDIHNIMALVQRDTGLLDRSLKLPAAQGTDANARNAAAQQEKFDEIHSLLVEQHARLSIGLTEYAGDLGRALGRGLEHIKIIQEQCNVLLNLETHKDFQQFVWQLVREGQAALQHRDRLLSRIDIQLKVLYNLMQQRIAREAKSDSDSMRTIADASRRDSLEMKGIAWLTMTFLPMTALASVFSMSSFFTDYTGPASSRLQLSPQFWIFWAITAPVTIFILAGWTFWKEWHWRTPRVQNAHTRIPSRPLRTHKDIISFDSQSPFSCGIPLPSMPTRRRDLPYDDRPHHSLDHIPLTPAAIKSLPQKIFYAEGEERTLPGHNEVVRPPTGYAVHPGTGIGRPFELP